MWGDGPKLDFECNFEILLRQPDKLDNRIEWFQLERQIGESAAFVMLKAFV